MRTNDTHGTEGTSTGDSFTLPVWERLESLTEAVATANYRTRRMAEEVAALRYVVVFALCLAGAFYVLARRQGVSL